ncbi:MAG: hypothetical protein MI861_19745 [Pirellulales bacterium]|nr:hypothetical protein [Pirellulales bacterium]
MNPSTIAISLNFEHSYAEQLPEFFASVWPTPIRKPSLLQFNKSLKHLATLPTCIGWTIHSPERRTQTQRGLVHRSVLAVDPYR